MWDELAIDPTHDPKTIRRAYAVRLNGRIIGLVCCKLPLPFRAPVEFV